MIYIQQKRILIKYYQTIITLEDHLLEVKMNDRIVSIHGEQLMIQYYSQDEILISGQVNHIYFS